MGDVRLALYGDLTFGEYSSRLADAHARTGGRTFLSRFDRQRGGSQPVAYAWHCADVPFAFGNLDEESVRFLIGGPSTAADHHLSDRMSAAWAGFAATGEPGWEPLGAPGGPARTWETTGTTRAPAPGHWADSATVRTLWRELRIPAPEALKL